MRLDPVFFTDTNRADQRADSDPCGSQIIYFVNLQYCVDTSGFCQDISYCISCYGVQSAAKGVQLNDFKLFVGFCVVGSSIQSGMIHPLVRYIQRAVHFRQVRNRILCQYRNTIRGDQFRNTVVDLRINMIRTAA